jgi:hypothetical protein
MTDPNPTVRVPLPEEPASSAPPPMEPAASPPPPQPAAPPPTWTARRSRDDGRAASVIFGIILLGIGAWFFAEQTLGLDLPDVSWGDLWPLILIGIGGWIVLGALRGRD